MGSNGTGLAGERHHNEMHPCSQHPEMVKSMAEVAQRNALVELSLQHTNLELQRLASVITDLSRTVKRMGRTLRRVRSGQEITKRWLILAGTVCTVVGGCIGSVTTAAIVHADKLVPALKSLLGFM